MKMARFQTFWIHMRKNKHLDESRKTGQTSGTKMAFYPQIKHKSMNMKFLKLPFRNQHLQQVASRYYEHQKFALFALHRVNRCTTGDQYVQHERILDLIHLVYL
ncbi:hypothetical protein Hanom_Chr03g00247971 [Helianthus anomalus]